MSVIGMLLSMEVRKCELIFDETLKRFDDESSAWFSYMIDAALYWFNIVNAIAACSYGLSVSCLHEKVKSSTISTGNSRSLISKSISLLQNSVKSSAAPLLSMEERRIDELSEFFI